MDNLNMINKLIGMFHNFGPEGKCFKLFCKVVAESGYEPRSSRLTYKHSTTGLLYLVRCEYYLSKTV